MTEQRMQMTTEDLALRLFTSGECLLPPEGERLLRELTAKVRAEVMRENADFIIDSTRRGGNSVQEIAHRMRLEAERGVDRG